MEIRRFKETDSIDDVSRVYAESWKYAYRGIIPQDYLDGISETRWSEYLRREIPNLWIVSDDKRIIGASTYSPARDSKYAGWGEIVSIYLLPEYFHRRIGTRLLNASVNELISKGYGSSYLWVLEDNLAARKFYEKNGFSYSGEMAETDIGGKKLNELRYVLIV